MLLLNYFLFFNVIWKKFYLIFLTFLFLFFAFLIFGLVCFNYILGMSIFLLNISFILWFIRYFGGFFLIFRHYNINIFLILFLLMFDNFVVLLRPVTLTLRVFINVSLGHFLVEILSVSFSTLLFMIFLLEMFVYLVQSFVFITLTVSYVDYLN